MVQIVQRALIYSQSVRIDFNCEDNNETSIRMVALRQALSKQNRFMRVDGNSIFSIQTTQQSPWLAIRHVISRTILCQPSSAQVAVRETFRADLGMSAYVLPLSTICVYSFDYDITCMIYSLY